MVKPDPPVYLGSQMQYGQPGVASCLGPRSPPPRLSWDVAPHRAQRTAGTVEMRRFFLGSPSAAAMKAVLSWSLPLSAWSSAAHPPPSPSLSGWLSCSRKACPKRIPTLVPKGPAHPMCVGRILWHQGEEATNTGPPNGSHGWMDVWVAMAC